MNNESPQRTESPPRVDPVAEARREWEERWSPDVGLSVEAILSVMRVQQIFLLRLNALLKPFGLTFPRYEALILLHFSRTGAVALGKIGERLGAHRASVTKLIDGLEVAGLARRKRVGADRRVVLAEILPEGRRVAEEATRALNEAWFATTPLTRRELESLVRLLRAVRADAGDIPE
jgi:DNA-binding MarR family transcriptional regulator